MAIGSQARSTFLAIVKGDASQAITEFKKLDGAVTKSTHGATGGMSKFQAATQGLKAELLAAAKSPAVWAGGIAAAGAGAIMAANKFSELAKRSIDLSKATALSVEESSRWIAVADDFGISADALQTGLGRIVKTLDSSKWSTYGIATRDASGAAKSANDIFLQALDVLSKTTNETERATIGNDLFGKGYANIAPMIGKTRAEYEQMLGAVSSGQTITAGEAERAEKWRLASDKLGDAFDDLVYAFGDLAANAAPLVDLFASLVETASDLIGLVGEGDLSKPLATFGQTAGKAEASTSDLIVAFDQFTREVGDARSGLDKTGIVLGELFDLDGSTADLIFDNYKKAITELASTAPEQAGRVLAALTELVIKADQLGQTEMLQKQGLNLDSVMQLAELAAEAAGGMDNLGWSAKNTSSKIEDVATGLNLVGSGAQSAKDKIALLQGILNEKKSWNSLQQTLLDAQAKIAELGTAFDESKISGTEAWLGIEEQVLDSKQALIDFLAEIDNIPESTKLDIIANFNINNLQPTIARVQAYLDTHPVTTPIMRRHANGGRSNGGMALVGEYGPEMVNLPAGAMVSTAAQTRAMLSGGGGITVVVNAPVGANMIEAGRQVADALNDYYRSGGQRVA